MATAADYESQLNDLNKQYAQYTPVNAGDINAYLTNKVGNFTPQYNEIANLKTQAYAAPTQMMADYNKQFGTDPSQGINANDFLNKILNQIGTNYGRADVAQGALNTQQGNINNLATNAFNQYNQQGQNLKDQWTMVKGLYDSKLAQEQAQQAAAAQSAYLQSLYGQGGGGSTQVDPTTIQPGQEQDLGNPTEVNNQGGNFWGELGNVYNKGVQPALDYINPFAWKQDHNTGQANLADSILHLFGK